MFLLTEQAYISDRALIILGDAQTILQTIYLDAAGPLEAVTIEESSGRIAVCDCANIYIYKPLGREEDDLRWAQAFQLSGQGQNITCLSWGSESELLVGGDALHLWNINDESSLQWKQKLAYPVRTALFSPDASLIASTGHYDKLVKIWRRQSFEDGDPRFDVSYLRHPGAVTGIHWRKPWHAEQNMDDLLYTFCSDNKIRFWIPASHHALAILQSAGDVDMTISIQPRRRGSKPLSTRRYGFVIDSRDFSSAAECAVTTSPHPAGKDHALEHLIEIANRSPEIVVVVDDTGCMSAWGLESTGEKRKPLNIFNIAHVQGFNISLDQQMTSDDYIRIHVFAGNLLDPSLRVLVQHYDGRINWYDSNITEIFDTAPRHDRAKFRTCWSGHDGAIKKVIRSLSGKTIMSRTDENHAVVWKQKSDDGPRIARHSSLTCEQHIHRSCVLDSGKHLVNLHHDSISLWDISKPAAQQISDVRFSLSGKLLCVLQIPTADVSSTKAFIAVMTSNMEGAVFRINLAEGDTTQGHASLQQYCHFSMQIPEPLFYVVPVDPAGSRPRTSDSLDTFATDIALAYSASGVLRMMAARVDEAENSVDWLVTATIETGIPHISLASGSSIRKAAVINQSRNRLTVWDTTDSQLEHDQQYAESDIIQDLDWTSTPDNQSVLAIGFPTKVVLLSQLRYDYLQEKPAWASIHEIEIKSITPHPIGDSCWLGNGHLVVGAGNQMFVYDRNIQVAEQFASDFRLTRAANVDLFQLVRRLNGPLPVFHPQFLGQCILTGKAHLVHKILTTMLQKLKFEAEDVDSFLDLPLEIFTESLDDTYGAESKEMHSSFATFSIEEEPQIVDESVAASLTENLLKVTLPQISHHEQFALADIIECVAAVEKHRRSMDENASRYLLFFRQHLLQKGQHARSQLSWREIVWAFHSNSKEMLVDLVTRSFQGRLLWEHARESGMFMWITDNAALRKQVEVLARNEYTKTEEKNPVDCSLFYLALGKKAILQGLWRIASWNREQASTIKILANNFSEPRWKTAALKNAYALMGKHRFEYAAAFFLLAGSLRDAVNVCLHQMRDLQLAITIARVYEGDDGSVLQDLLEDHVLAEAAETGNRWMATWAFWMLKKRDKAIRALVSPIHTLLNDSPTSTSPSPSSPASNSLQAKSYLSNDPALVVLYLHLRSKTLSTLRGATMIKPKEEWAFIIRNARLYSRMGCDLLALDLVRNWEFMLAPPPPAPTPARAKLSITPNQSPDPRLLLRRRSSQVVDDLQLTSPTSPRPWAPPSPSLPPEITPAKATTSLKPPPPTVFEEPDPNALLDAFGF